MHYGLESQRGQHGVLPQMPEKKESDMIKLGNVAFSFNQLLNGSLSGILFHHLYNLYLTAFDNLCLRSELYIFDKKCHENSCYFLEITEQFSWHFKSNIVPYSHVYSLISVCSVYRVCY